MNRRVHLLVTGKVQGVFFRQTMKVRAVENGVSGWVRNLEDGRVEAVLEGDGPGVEAVTRWARAGPANSRVEDVRSTDEEFAGEFSGFDVRY